MSVQVFTVPTVARNLIVTENVVALVMSALTTFCQKYVICTSLHISLTIEIASTYSYFSVSPSNIMLSQFDFSSDPNPAVLKRKMLNNYEFGFVTSKYI